MSKSLILTLVCSPELDEKLLDQLLITCPSVVFTSQEVASHGLAHQLFNPAELVMGRSKSVQVQILLTSRELEELMIILRDEFNDVGLRYWIIPVADSGEIK
jgi:hypothetical protein